MAQTAHLDPSALHYFTFISCEEDFTPKLWNMLGATKKQLRETRQLNRH